MLKPRKLRSVKKKSERGSLYKRINLESFKMLTSRIRMRQKS